MAAEARPAMVSSIIGPASLGGTAGSRSFIRPYVIFDCGACVADLGFYRGEASVGRLRSWLRRLRSVEAERDGFAEELEDAALSGGRRCQFFEAFPAKLTVFLVSVARWATSSWYPRTGSLSGVMRRALTPPFQIRHPRSRRDLQQLVQRVPLPRRQQPLQHTTAPACAGSRPALPGHRCRAGVPRRPRPAQVPRTGPAGTCRSPGR